MSASFGAIEDRRTGLSVFLSRLQSATVECLAAVAAYYLPHLLLIEALRTEYQLMETNNGRPR